MNIKNSMEKRAYLYKWNTFTNSQKSSDKIMNNNIIKLYNMNLQDRKIAVIGLGYVGLPLALEYGKKNQLLSAFIVVPVDFSRDFCDGAVDFLLGNQYLFDVIIHIVHNKSLLCSLLFFTFFSNFFRNS